MRRLVLTALATVTAVTSTLALTGAGNEASASVGVDQVYPVPSSGTFAVRGHGWGHGHGMSQYGAQGAALQGLDAQKILAFYYPGTVRGNVAGTDIRVLVGADTTDPVTVDPRSGLAVTDLGKGVTRTLPARSDIDGWQLTTAADGRGLVQWQDARGLWRMWRPRGWNYLAGEGQFSSSQGPVTLRTPSGSRAYRGALRAAAPAAGSTARDTVNVVDIDDYVKGVIPAEMPASWHRYAVRAQAVAARTYAMYEQAVSTGRYFDVYDTTRSQVYGGVRVEDPRSNDAAEMTAGQVRLWNGKPAFTQFCSSNGGWTSAGSPDTPYLAHTADPYDGVSVNKNHSWSTTLSARRIQGAYPGIGRLLRVRVIQREGGGDWQGRVERLVLEGVKGEKTLSGDTFRSVFGLKSTWFRL